MRLRPALYLCLLASSCPAIVFGWLLPFRLRGITSRRATRPVVSDSCGQAAFDAAPPHVCGSGMKLDIILPIGILWVNCKLAATGSTDLMLVCRKFSAHTFVDDTTVLAQCVHELPRRKFVQLLEYAMIAFEVCEDVANEYVGGEVRAAIDALIREASKSGDVQEGLRDELELLIKSSKDVVEESERLQEIQNSAKGLESKSKNTAKLIGDTLSTAIAASASITAQYRSLCKRVAENVQETATASEEMTGMVTETISEMNSIADLRVTAAQWNTYKEILACALVGIVAISGISPVNDVWPVLIRASCTAVAAAVVHTNRSQLLGSHHVAYFLVLSSFFIVLLASDIYFCAKHLLPVLQKACRGEEAGTRTIPGDSEGDTNSCGSIEAHSFQTDDSFFQREGGDIFSASDSNTCSKPAGGSKSADVNCSKCTD